MAPPGLVERVDEALERLMPEVFRCYSGPPVLRSSDGTGKSAQARFNAAIRKAFDRRERLIAVISSPTDLEPSLRAALPAPLPLGCREVLTHFFYGVSFFRAIPKPPLAKHRFAIIEEACLMTIQTPIPGHGPGTPKPILISMAQLCLMLSVSESTVNRWTRTFPEFPQALRPPSGTIRFHLAEVEAFIAALPRCEFDVLPRVRPDKSVSVRFADESAAQVTETDVTLTAEGHDRSAMARRLASAVARMMGWVDIAAPPTWPFARSPEVGETLPITPNRLRDTIVRRLEKANALFLNPEPEVRSRVIELLAKSYRTFPFAIDRLRDGEAVLILTPECVMNLLDDPGAAVDRLQGLKRTHGNLSTLILRTDKPTRLTNLADLATLYGNKIPREKAFQAQPSFSRMQPPVEIPNADGPALETASPESPPTSALEPRLEIPENDDSYRMGM